MNRPAEGGSRLQRASETVRTWSWTAGVVALAAVALVLPMAAAAPGAVDDHDIPALRSAGLDGLGDFIFESGRFRPIYWMVRFAESWLWGQWVQGWYLDRLVLLAVTVFAASLLLMPTTGPRLSALGAALLVLGPQAESWFRLGPQEAIATPLLLSALVLIARGRGSAGLLLLVLCAGTKEAYVPIALAGAAWAWWRGYRWPAYVAGLFIFAMSAIVLQASANAPAYIGQRTLDVLAMTAAVVFAETALWTAWPVAALAAVRLAGWRPWGLAVAAAVGITSAHVLIHAGLTEGRYLLPLVLLAVVASTFGLAHLRTHWPRIAAPIVGYLIVVVFAWSIVSFLRASEWAADTRVWHEGIVAIRHSIRPGDVVVIATGPWEAVVAAARYVETAPVMLYPTPPTGSSRLELATREWWTKTSRDGGGPFVPWRPSESCIEAFFDAAPQVCDRGVRLVSVARAP